MIATIAYGAGSDFIEIKKRFKLDIKDEIFTVPIPPYFVYKENTVLSYTIDKSSMNKDVTITLLEASTECTLGDALTYSVDLAEAITFATADLIELTIRVSSDAVAA